MDALDVNKVSVGYANDLIIKDLSVSMPKHKITTIVGPKGCGKSTL